MRKISVLFSLLTLFTVTIAAQNKSDYFKMMPYWDESEPDWVQMMYSENPNVYEVAELYEAFYKRHEFEKNSHTQNL